MNDEWMIYLTEIGCKPGGSVTRLQTEITYKSNNQHQQYIEQTIYPTLGGSCFSLWRAHGRPKHAETDKYTKDKLCTKFTSFARLYRDARSTKHKKKLGNLLHRQLFWDVHCPILCKNVQYEPDFKNSVQWTCRSKRTLHTYYKEILYQMKSHEGEEGLVVQLHALLKVSTIWKLSASNQDHFTTSKENPPPPHPLGRSR